MPLRCRESRHSADSSLVLILLVCFFSMYCYLFTQLILRKGPIKLSVESWRYFRLSFHVQEAGFGTAAVPSRISDVGIAIFIRLVSDSRESTYSLRMSNWNNVYGQISPAVIQKALNSINHLWVIMKPRLQEISRPWSVDRQPQHSCFQTHLNYVLFYHCQEFHCFSQTRSNVLSLLKFKALTKQKYR